VAGAGPGLLALFLLGPQSLAPLAALATGVAALLVGQLLPARGDRSEEEGDEREEPASGDLAARAAVLLPAAGLGAAAVLVPSLALVERGPRGPADVAPLLLLSLALLAAALFGRLLAGRPQDSLPAALPSALAALLLAALAVGAAAWLPPSLAVALAVALPPTLPSVALLIVPALLLAGTALLAHPAGQRADPGGASLAAAAGLAPGLLLLHLAGTQAAAALAAALLLAAALARRPR